MFPKSCYINEVLSQMRQGLGNQVGRGKVGYTSIVENARESFLSDRFLAKPIKIQFPNYI